jgi:hypothetical protein
VYTWVGSAYDRALTITEVILPVGGSVELSVNSIGVVGEGVAAMLKPATGAFHTSITG